MSENLRDTLQHTERPGTETRPRTQWIVMAYLAGDNNLTEEMVLALQQIESRNKWPVIQVTAQLDPSGVGIPTQRYAFVDRTPQKNYPIEEYLVKPRAKFGETNTGNPGALSDFIRWAVNEKKYLQNINREEDKPDGKYRILILSGHGSGATEDFLLVDRSHADSLSIPELELALKNAIEGLKDPDTGKELESGIGGKIHVLGMDACFMCMAEVCYQVRNYVTYLVGAQGFEPEFGWPYHRILEDAGTISGLVQPDQVVKIIVENYVDYYNDFDRLAGRSVDLAAIELERVGELAKTDGPLSQLKDALLAVLPEGQTSEDTLYDTWMEQIVLAHWEAQTFKFHQFVDLRDLCERLKARFAYWPADLEAVAVVNACEVIVDMFDPRDGVPIVVKGGCSGPAYQHAHGLSIYFPWAEFSDEYSNLAFAIHSGWDKFLKEYIKQTKREKRKVRNPQNGRFEEITPDDKCFQDAVDKLGEIIRDRLARQLCDELKNGVTSNEALIGGHRYNRASKYNRASRYNRASKYGLEQDKTMKNFTVVAGKAFYPERRSGADRAATRRSRDV